MNENNIRQAIVLLTKEGVLTWNSLEAIIYEMSRQGWGRARIVDLCSSIMKDSAWELNEEELDFLGDFTLHLIGQCNADQIIRLAGDPEDVHELASLVSSSDWRTRPRTS
jgi:hypothetical protein